MFKFLKKLFMSEEKATEAQNTEAPTEQQIAETKTIVNAVEEIVKADETIDEDRELKVEKELVEGVDYIDISVKEFVIKNDNVSFLGGKLVVNTGLTIALSGELTYLCTGEQIQEDGSFVPVYAEFTCDSPEESEQLFNELNAYNKGFFETAEAPISEESRKHLEMCVYWLDELIKKTPILDIRPMTPKEFEAILETQTNASYTLEKDAEGYYAIINNGVDSTRYPSDAKVYLPVAE